MVEKNPEQLKTKPEQDIKNPDEKKPTLKEKLQPIENDPTKVERKREPLPPPPPQPPRPETKGPCDPCTNCNPGCKGKPETKVAADVNEERTKVLQSNAAAAAAAFTQPPAEPSAFQPPVAPANFTPPVVADATAFVPPAPPERSVAN